jgi:hypothetical protein
MGLWGGVWRAELAVSKLWCGEALYKLGVQSADVSLGFTSAKLVSSVSGKFSSHDLQLCPSHHRGSSGTAFFIHVSLVFILT